MIEYEESAAVLQDEIDAEVAAWQRPIVEDLVRDPGLIVYVLPALPHDRHGIARAVVEQAAIRSGLVSRFGREWREGGERERN